MVFLELEKAGTREMKLTMKHGTKVIKQLDLFDIILKDCTGVIIQRIEGVSKIDLYDLADDIIDIRGY